MHYKCTRGLWHRRPLRETPHTPGHLLKVCLVNLMCGLKRNKNDHTLIWSTDNPLSVVLLSSLSGFCLSSGLLSSQSPPCLSFNLSRSLSLCFLDFFFLCWLLGSCWWVQSESPWGGWWLLTVGSLSLLSETGVSGVLGSLCIRGKPLCPPAESFGLLVLWNSVFVWKLGLRVGSAPSCPPLLFGRPFTEGCCCNLCSVSLCLLAARLSSESKGTGRFCDRQKKRRVYFYQSPTLQNNGWKRSSNHMFLQHTSIPSLTFVNISKYNECFTIVGFFTALRCSVVSSDVFRTDTFAWLFLKWLLLCGCNFLLSRSEERAHFTVR